MNENMTQTTPRLDASLPTRQPIVISPAMVGDVYPGIWKIRIGEPESIVPTRYRDTNPAASDHLPPVAECPLDVRGWQASNSAQGFTLVIPSAGQAFYGLGLQLKSLNHFGKKRVLRVNSDPPGDTGDSHAPVPLLISNQGWGLFFDTARYLQLYVASHHHPVTSTQATDNKPVATDTDTLYGRGSGGNSPIQVHIPGAHGVDVYIIAGPTMREVVCRYNLFSGGGCLPSLKGLGVWYRTCAKWDQKQILAAAEQLRQSQMPCDILGLEPGWQSHAYPCSFQWDAGRFPQPRKLIDDLAGIGYEVNLWEHAFIHPSSPLLPAIGDKHGQWAVFDGTMPDMLDPQVLESFTTYHQQNFVAQGIGGFKLDECDNSDFIHKPWSFPEHDRFPSGADGEQMHSLFGLAYQRSIGRAFRRMNRRTYSEVRSSHALAAPEPFVLYSDLYDHRAFVRGMCTAGFSGLLWTPEVRHADSSEDLIRRIQSVILSPQALINAWYLEGFPWDKDYAHDPPDRHSAGHSRKEPAVNLTVEETREACRRALRLRMRLIPYLYSAFADYRVSGLPPVRALAMDWPDDPQVRELDDQFMVGPDLLAVALFTGQRERRFYLPTGIWHDIFTGETYSGGQHYQRPVTLNQMLLFAAEGTLLPLARPVEHITDKTVFTVDVHHFGNATRPCRLYEDDGFTYDFESGRCNQLHLSLNAEGILQVDRQGNYKPARYRLAMALGPVQW